LREVNEELGLTEGIDYSMTSEPVAHIEFVAFSHRANTETHYVLKAFALNGLTQQARTLITTNPDNRWVTAEEIRARETHDNKPISETMSRLLPYLESSTP
jgi:hypothetical protein